MKIKKSISKKICESCLKAKQQLESSRRSMSKAIAFLDRIHVNIKDLLLVTFRSNRYFLLIKNDVFNMFFIYVIKTKNKILLHLKKFRI